MVNLTATVKQLSFTIEGRRRKNSAAFRNILIDLCFPTRLGSYLNSLHIRTVGRCELASWSIIEAPPIPTEYNQRQEYFIMMTHGLDAPPMNITMEFNVRINSFMSMR